MSLYDQWKKELENQTEDTYDEFWDRYSKGETKIYSSILSAGDPTVTGIVEELAKEYGVDSVIFMGFLDGINTSLAKPLDLENLSLKDQVSLTIDFEKLYFNMLAANADYLYTLSQWQDILSDERRLEIEKQYKKSKTIVKEKAPGRNDPCPCGSGKKYKKCCGS